MLKHHVDALKKVKNMIVFFTDNKMKSVGDVFRSYFVQDTLKSPKFYKYDSN